MATPDTERLAPDPRQAPLAYDEPTLRAHIDQALQAEPPEIQAQRQTLIAQMQQDLFDWRRDPQTVDMTRWTDVNPTRELIRNMGEAAQERAYFIERDGITIAPGTAQEIGTGGTDFAYLATKVHPVWADELRYQTQHLREMGEIGTQAQDLRPWETDYAAWPSAEGAWSKGVPNDLAQMTEDAMDRWIMQEQAQAPREALTPEQRRALRHSLHGLHRQHGPERHSRAQEGSGYGD